VDLPLIEPGINLRNPKQQPLYRFVFVLAAVADIVYNEERNMYMPMLVKLPVSQTVTTEWHSWKQKSATQVLSLALQNWTNPAGCTLILAAGIEFGVPLSNTEVQLVKYAGTAKIMRME
jgi:hypothetical protein